MQMIALAAGYQHFADGAPFAEIALRHPAVQEVYFPWVDEPSGRPKLGYEEEDDPAELEAALRRDLTRLKQSGVRLDLLLNANCYGAEAMSKALEARIGGIVEKLASWGCRPEVCTTASPFVARTLKAVAPDIEVRASVNMRLRNTLALEYLAPMYDSYYICRDVQRDLPTFRLMAKWCHDHGKKLCMLANSGCVRNCPWQVFHETLLSHRFTDTIPEMGAQNLELLCNRIFSQKKTYSDFLRCSWIRPEDVHVFEPELETIKLSTREAKYPHEIVEAYVNGSYDGNLLRLMDPYHAFGFRPNRIDNKSFPADWVTSGIAGKCAENCMHCGKCEEILKQVTKFDLDTTARIDGFSFVENFYLLAPKKKENRAGNLNYIDPIGGKHS
jgi:ferredoxin